MNDLYASHSLFHNLNKKYIHKKKDSAEIIKQYSFTDWLFSWCARDEFIFLFRFVCTDVDLKKNEDIYKKIVLKFP